MWSLHAMKFFPNQILSPSVRMPADIHLSNMVVVSLPTYISPQAKIASLLDKDCFYRNDFTHARLDQVRSMSCTILGTAFNTGSEYSTGPEYSSQPIH